MGCVVVSILCRLCLLARASSIQPPAKKMPVHCLSVSSVHWKLSAGGYKIELACNETQTTKEG